MDAVNELCEMLAKKNDIFLQYEKDTDALLSCEIEDIEVYIKKRSNLSEEVDRIDAALDKLADSCADSKAIRQALKNQCGRNQIPLELRPVFDSAQQIFSIIHRIQRMESRAEERIKFEQGMLLEQIKKLNRSTTAQASKFYDTAGRTSQDSFFPASYKKV